MVIFIQQYITENDLRRRQYNKYFVNNIAKIHYQAKKGKKMTK